MSHTDNKRKYNTLEELIIKYIIGEKIPKEEMQSLKTWLGNLENKKHFKEIVKTHHHINNTYNSIDIESAYKKVSEKILNDKANIKRIAFYKTMFRYAATTLIFISISFGVYSYFLRNNQSENNHITLQLVDGSFNKIKVDQDQNITNGVGDIVAKVENGILSMLLAADEFNNDKSSQINVPFGEKIKIRLPDNTLISLNSGSLLRIPQSYLSNKQRDVFLEGEGYFDVSKDKDKPFTVHIKEMNIRVLGTRFNISNYNNDESAFVALEEGSVAVNRPDESFDLDESIVLKPGEHLVVKDEIFKVEETNVKKDIAWSRGELFFENDRFQDIIKELERHYNVLIENNSQDLNNIRYTGTFTTETITEVFEIFNELSEFKYEILDDRIIISTLETFSKNK